MSEKDKKAKWSMIPLVRASDMPDAVIDWCEENDISHHYKSSLAILADDGSSMAEWLKEIGVPKEESAMAISKITGKALRLNWYDWRVAVSAT